MTHDKAAQSSREPALLYQARALDGHPIGDGVRARVVAETLTAAAGRRWRATGWAEASFASAPASDTALGQCTAEPLPRPPPMPIGEARSVSWLEWQWVRAKSFWSGDTLEARYWRFLVEVAGFALGELIALRAATLLRRHDVLGEGGRVVGHLRGYQRVHRYEPRGVTTPMTPHRSPYLDIGDAVDWYHLRPAHYRSLFTVTGDTLPTLRRLRQSQGYFDGDVVLRSARVRDLIERYPDARILADFKFSLTELEGRLGAYNFVIQGN